MFSRFFLCLCFFTVACLGVHAQPCAEMANVFNEVTGKMRAKMKGKENPSADDLSYLLSICNNATATLDKLVKGATDENTLESYRYYLVVMHTQIATFFAQKGQDQAVYDLLQPIREKAFILDNMMLKESAPIVCTKTDNSYSVTYGTTYAKASAGYNFLYIDACLKLGKQEEADMVFNKMQAYSYGMNSEGKYDACALIIHAKINGHVADPTLLTALSASLDAYTNWYAYDSTTLTISEVINIIMMPGLVDTKDDKRAQAFYHLYEIIHKYARIHSGEPSFSEEVQSAVLKQSLRSFSNNSVMPEFTGDFKYNSMLVQSLMELKEPSIYKAALARMTDFINANKGNISSKFFWLNMSALYAANDMIKEAGDAQKKSNKYKY